MADYISQFTGAEIDQRLAKVSQLETSKQDKLVSGSNIKTINGQSVLGSGDMQIQAGDTDAVKYVAQTLTDAQKAQARTNIAAASAAELGQIVTDLTGIEADIDSLEAAVAAINVGDYVTATTLPTASASTMGHIYLIGPDANNNYDRYFTQESSGTYSWVSLGSTQIDLSTYATQAEVDQLEAEVHNLSGKYYGIFEDAESLPEGDAVGYAFVGTQAPFAIYQFDGTDWADSEAEAQAIYGEPGADGVGLQTITSLQDGTVVLSLTNGDTVTLDLNHNHPQYYSKEAEASQPQGGFLPDVIYKLGTLTGSVTFALAAAVTGNANHYFIVFDTGGTAPTITWPAGLTWADGSAPTVAASKHYEVSIMDGIAAYLEV